MIPVHSNINPPEQRKYVQPGNGSSFCRGSCLQQLIPACLFLRFVSVVEFWVINPCWAHLFQAITPALMVGLTSLVSALQLHPFTVQGGSQTCWAASPGGKCSHKAMHCLRSLPWDTSYLDHDQCLLL